jgi:preprotein translocase subunit YajC
LCRFHAPVWQAGIQSGHSGAIAFASSLVIFAAARSWRAQIFAAKNREIRRGDLFTPAFAQAPAGGPPGAGDIFINLVPFAIIFAIAYFLVLRPQRRKTKQQADMLKNVRRGDNVIMSGGLIGKITRVVDDNEIELEIAPSVRVRVARAMISEVRSKGEPVKDQG